MLATDTVAGLRSFNREFNYKHKWRVSGNRVRDNTDWYTELSFGVKSRNVFLENN